MKLCLLLVLEVIIFTANVDGKVNENNYQRHDDLNSKSSSKDSVLDKIRRSLNQPFLDYDYQFNVENIEQLEDDQPNIVNLFLHAHENEYSEEYESQEQQPNIQQNLHMEH
ncbi:hypothetical protein RN001_011359 [Aquatica leii]|uniref:Uncharacterized protein n=1 Tax=Aquatica leii TaxID=1421715 RepID=A0AAN7QI28_9COLE|nr:hypothetical protein RN001_011359 [Aquatica leii]